MRSLQLEHVSPGMVLAKAVFDAQGNVLLGSGLELTQPYLDRLGDLGITRIYVTDGTAEDLDIREVLPDMIRAKTVASFRKVFGPKGMDLSGIGRIVDSLLDEILSADYAVINLSNLKQVTSERFQHAVDTCSLGVAFGLRMGVTGDRLKKLAMGLLLHDVGLAAMPPGSLDSKLPLTGTLEALYRQHPEAGWSMLKDRDDISPLTRAVIIQHHERWDGSGYPHGLKGDQIHEFGQIGGLIQTYDSLTSTRPYRAAVKPHEAVEYLLGCAGRHFQQEMIKAFVRKVPAYPIGSTVVLSTGDTAVVTDFNPDLPLRPPVQTLGQPQIIDLAQEPSITIETIL